MSSPLARYDVHQHQAGLDRAAAAALRGRGDHRGADRVSPSSRLRLLARRLTRRPAAPVTAPVASPVRAAALVPAAVLVAPVSPRVAAAPLSPIASRPVTVTPDARAC